MARADADVPKRAAGNQDTIRVFLNGCWDLPHSGHFNAFRQARLECARLVGGDDSRVVLVCGVHPNHEIRREKGGAFVMSEKEKDVVLRACRFIDEVVHDVPYDEMSPELLDSPQIRCDVVSHGDDPVMLKKGVGMYAASKAAGRYVEFPRTEGISTTHLIDRVLSVASGKHYPLAFEACLLTVGLAAAFSRASVQRPLDASAPQCARIGYVDGHWDLLHAGHIRVLSAAREVCDLLLVGVHSNQAVRGYRGEGWPIMSMGERLLLVSSCRYVEDAVLDAPLILTAPFLRSLRVSVVVRVLGHRDFDAAEERFAEAKAQGLLEDLTISDFLCTDDLVNRVAGSQGDMEARQQMKRPLAK